MQNLYFKMERLREIQEYTNGLVRQYEACANQKQAERVQARDEAIAISKLVELDSKELKIVEALDGRYLVLVLYGLGF